MTAPAPTAYIVAIGNELLNGSVVDTNSAYLAAELRRSGMRLLGVSVVEDDLGRIKTEVLRAALEADLVITTGGLGPTSDDLTRNAIADAAGEPLEYDQEAYIRLEALFKRRDRPLNETNLRQIYFPRGAEVIPNPIGSADAFLVLLPGRQGVRTPVISIPGVPAEVRKLVEVHLRDWLKARFSELASLRSSALKCFGVSEAYLGSCIEGAKMPSGIQVAYGPSFPEVLLVFSAAQGSNEGSSDQLLAEAQDIAAAAIGEQFVFSRKDIPMAEALGEMLEERSLTLAAAESCSGGLLAHQLVSKAGASKFFTASLVTYSNSAKETFLGVRPELLRRFGAVSEETAVAMAQGAKYRCGSDYSLAITGVAGPEGGSEEKPVGLVWLAMSTPRRTVAFKHLLPWGRSQIRSYAVTLALDLVRREILGYPLTWEKR